MKAPHYLNNANWLLTGEGEMLLNNNEVREPDERKWSTPDLRKRIDRVEVLLKGKFKDFEYVAWVLPGVLYEVRIFSEFCKAAVARRATGGRTLCNVL